MFGEEPETAPRELVIRLANSLTEFLDYFRADPCVNEAVLKVYEQDVDDAESVLADFDAWAGDCDPKERKAV